MGIEIPIEPAPDSVIDVSLDSVDYTFRIHWNDTAACYFLSIDGAGRSLKGIRLVIGVNFFEKHAVSDVGGLYLFDTSGLGSDPAYDDLGSKHLLVYEPL